MQEDLQIQQQLLKHTLKNQLAEKSRKTGPATRVSASID